MRRTLAGLVAALALATQAHAMDLYEARTIVSGTIPATRADGLARCLRDVLVKVSGDPALADDPRVAPLAAKAGTVVEDFAYLDRMSDLPRHDEQGSRDRPFTLIAHFAPAKIAAALATLGTHPWRGPRLPLLIRITIHDRDGSIFPIAATTDSDERQREALLAAADRYAMRVILPPSAAPGTIPLAGTLAWSDTAAGWVGDWTLPWHGRPHHWTVSGVSFDEAFRNAIRGAMAVLSGHVPR